MAKKLEDRVSDLERRMDLHDENSIVNDLCEERFPGSGKPRYSYEDLAQKWQVPKSRIQDIAKRNGLERRRTTKFG
ncbi:hypothetical protein JQM60_10715 [Butyricicoccus pullicaecorum]|nr:hypothetical protein [Butyricicoccus pullicaecorum]